MSQHIDAIYDCGVLRPLEPLVLPDQALVKLRVDPAPVSAATDKLACQQAALVARWQELDESPQHENMDGWSVRQHDEILYSKR
jgi:predicted DNA-binding antitoxin AbrB/MazE fold protein